MTNLSEFQWTNLVLRLVIEWSAYQNKGDCKALKLKGNGAWRREDWQIKKTLIPTHADHQATINIIFIFHIIPAKRFRVNQMNRVDSFLKLDVCVKCDFPTLAWGKISWIFDEPRYTYVNFKFVNRAGSNSCVKPVFALSLALVLKGEGAV